MRMVFAASLVAVLGMLSACADTGGGYSSGYSSSYYDPWYYRGGYYYDDIHVPVYPNHRPGHRPGGIDPVRPSHPIALPDRPTVNPRPSIPTRARPSASSFSRGMSRGGGRGRGGRR